MRIALLTLGMLLGLLPAPRVQALQPDKAFHHYVRHGWSIDAGLPQITVQAIAQDRAGYIWVGTQAGLARFDGVRFTSFTPETERALPGVWVRALYAARDGRLWIGTYKGAAVHDGRRFVAVPAVDGQRWADLDVFAFAEDTRGQVWAATGSGVFVVRGDALARIVGSPSPAYAVWWEKDGLWVGGLGEVHRRDPAGRWHRFRLPEGATGAAVHRLLRAQGELWAATSSGLYRLDGRQWQPFDGVPALRDMPVELLYADGDGNLWAGGDTGLVRIRDGIPAEYVPAKGAGGIPGLRTAIEDREGNLWFGSQWVGLTRVTDSWTRRYSSAEGLHEPIVWSVARDALNPGRIWVGTNEGLALLERGRFVRQIGGDALPHPHAYNLFAERDRLWIGTRRGLAVLELDRSGRPRALRRPPEFRPLDGAQIHGFVRDASGALWIPTNEGVFRWADGRLRRYAEADGLGDPRTMFLHIARDGRVLVGSRTGVFVWQGGRFARLGGSPPQVSDISAIHELSDGTLVVGTLLERSYLADRSGRRWRRLGPDEGMPANSAFFFAELDGHLWVAGLRGISRAPLADIAALADGRSARVRGEMVLNERGDPRSGQQGYCCNGAGTGKGFVHGGGLWLPTRDGVVHLVPRDIVKNTVPPALVIERVQRDDRWLPAHEVAGQPLPADARDLAFEFTVLSFQDPESVAVDYRLRGYDRDWRAADPLNRTTRYTNLPPGKYLFEVRGTNNAGVPGRTASLAFSVRPRFHETGWFVALLGLLAASAVYLGYLYLQRRHRVQRRLLEELVRQRTQALEQARQSLEEASRTDPLTGLRNRRYVADQIPTDLAYYDRQLQSGLHQDEVMLLALVDIDHFKSINDRYGHKAGDRVLQQFARILAAQVRSGDYVARWGGEEFLLVFRPMPREHLAMLGRRLRNAVAEHRFDVGDGVAIRVTCSIGLAEYPLFRRPGARLSWEAMIELADLALYHVKSSGRDGWAAFRPTPQSDLETLLSEMHRDARVLLDQGRLAVLGEVAGRSIDRDVAAAGSAVKGP